MSDLFDFIETERTERGQFDQVAEAQALQAEVIETKRQRLDVFKDIMPSLQLTKKYILEDEKDYVPFLVNKLLSYHDDSIFYAAEMNAMYHLTHRMQYDFYFHSLRAKKRLWAAWIKPKKLEDLAAVKLYFGYSDVKAQTALKILTEEQLELIRKTTTPGE